MQRHFFAGGERQSLETAEDLLGIDTRTAAAAGLGDAVAKIPVGSKLPAGLVIVSREDCSGQLLKQLNAAGATLQPYRSQGAVVVLMPEVRVEFDPDQHAAALKAAAGSSVPMSVVESAPDRLSLRPESGKGEDALDLANDIHERLGSVTSSVRMLRVVPHPKGIASVTR